MEFDWDSNTSVLVLTNKNYFARLDNCRLIWSLLEDGVTIQEAKLRDVSIKPQHKQEISIDRYPLARNKEYVLLFQLVTNEKKGLLDANHELGFDQFVLQESSASQMYTAGHGQPEVIRGTENITVENGNSKLIIDSRSGEITHWSFEGKLITNEALRPNFWRAPTDNDLGNGMHVWAEVWQRATNEAQATLVEAPMQSRHGVSFKLDYKLPDNIAKLSVEYTLTGTGELLVDFEFKPVRDSLPNIPRLGMYLTLPNNFTNMSRYGRGPHETYWDRKTSGKVGIYKGLILDQFHRYSRPQETGNKTGIRWMSVMSNELIVSARPTDNQLLNASVWPFTTSELDFVAGKDGGESASGLVPVTSKHGAYIQIGKLVQWNTDNMQMGVGGDTSWGRLVHDEYSISAKSYHYSFAIVPKIK